jgi:hypothetical protein
MVRKEETPLVSNSGMKLVFNVVFGVKGWNASDRERMAEKKLVEVGGIWHVAAGVSDVLELLYLLDK